MRDVSQTADTVVLVRPSSFGFHAEAACSNAFANAAAAGEDAQRIALGEFDRLRSELERAGVRCLVLDDSPDEQRPDAIFPNNWVSFHGDGTMILYPMANPARRLERRPEAVAGLVARAGLGTRETIDLSDLEQRGAFLEGTGSLVLDRPNSRAFACRSPRTSAAAAEAFAEATGWEVVLFDSADRHGRQIYHTNVMLMLGSRVAVVCAEAISAADRTRVLDGIAQGGRELIEVDFAQMERFACNLLELKSADGEAVFALSVTACAAFTSAQRARLESHGRLVVADIPVIERIGGGSVRCMIAEVFLPPVQPSRPS